MLSGGERNRVHMAKLLKAGGTKHHSELLAPFGLDASDPQFWAQGLAVIESLIDELESLESE